MQYEMVNSKKEFLKKGKSKQVQWNEAQDRAYSLLKEYLLQEPVLKIPEQLKPFVLRKDASGVGAAIVLLPFDVYEIIIVNDNFRRGLISRSIANLLLVCFWNIGLWY